MKTPGRKGVTSASAQKSATMDQVAAALKAAGIPDDSVKAGIKEAQKLAKPAHKGRFVLKR